MQVHLYVDFFQQAYWKNLGEGTCDNWEQIFPFFSLLYCKNAEYNTHNIQNVW